MRRQEAFRLAQDKGRRGVVMRKTVLHLFMLLMLTGPAIFAIDNLKLTDHRRRCGIRFRSGQAQLRHYLWRRMLQFKATGAANG
jgi:hypothetical protein